MTTLARLLIVIGILFGGLLIYSGYLLFTENTTPIYEDILCEDGETIRREERPIRPGEVSVHHFCETTEISQDVTAAAAGLSAAMIGVPVLLTVLPLNIGVLLLRRQRKTEAASADSGV